MNTRKKEGATKGPASAGKRRPSSANRKSLPVTVDELPEQQVLIWPEWLDSEVASEKWSTKHVFEDPDGLVILPRSLRQNLETYKRISELSDIAPVGVSQTGLVDAYFHMPQQAPPPTSASAKSAAAVSPALVSHAFPNSNRGRSRKAALLKKGERKRATKQRMKSPKNAPRKKM